MSISRSVGALVWVRRRNGSWWPGRILGDDELPEFNLPSPRSGTPVKLLGREDASIDWYNLERSKRIKPFRCGEYDLCIEKAKASAAITSYRAAKYARRDDAILHALEIESAQKFEDRPEIWSTMDKPSKDCPEESLTSSLPDVDETDPTFEDLSSFEGNSNSAQGLSYSRVSFNKPNQVLALKKPSSQGRRRTPYDSEDDATQGMKRMRGLEDLGMGAVPSFKRKRSQVAKVHELLKKKNRHRQLTKVLESTVIVTVPLESEPLASPTESSMLGVFDSKISGLESNESKRSVSTVINNNSDSTGENGASLNASEHASDTLLINCKEKQIDISSMSGLPERDPSNRFYNVPLVGGDKRHADVSAVYLSRKFWKPQLGAGAKSIHSSQVEAVFVGIEEFNESGSTSSGAVDTMVLSNRIEKGSSKWKLKGKRNLRSTSKHKKQGSKKSVNADDEWNGYLAGDVGTVLISDNFAHQVTSRLVSESQVDEFQGWSNHTIHKEPQRSQPFRQSRVTINPKYQSSEIPHKLSDAGSSLHDVNLEVKASYRPQHVPYISLMSKLNGWPIIGHPVTVEVLEDGFCDHLLGCSYRYNRNPYLDEDRESTYALEGADMVYVGKPNVGGRRIPKHVALQRRASPCNSPKSRKNGILSKKTRKLSSLTGSHKQSHDVKKRESKNLKGPAVACVPLKVVFSRINAALNCSTRSVLNM